MTLHVIYEIGKAENTRLTKLLIRVRNIEYDNKIKNNLNINVNNMKSGIFMINEIEHCH